MQTINRDLFIITPRQPLVDWINQLDPEHPVTLNDVTGSDNADVFLIPEFDNDDLAYAWLSEGWEMWFEMLLNDWWTDESEWPQNRSWELFNEFFDISYQSMVLDTQPYPVLKEEVYIEDDEEFEEEKN